MKHHVSHSRIENHGSRAHLAINRLHSFSLSRAISLALISAAILSAIMTIGSIDPDTHRLDPDAHIGFMAAANVVVFILLYVYNFLLLKSNISLPLLLPLSMVGSLAITAAYTALAWILERALFGDSYNNLPIALAAGAPSALIAALISLLLHNVTVHQQTLVENEHLQAENARIRHHALEQQLSPHFLFNTLGTIDALVGTDDKRAHDCILQLVDIYRYILRHQSTATLRQELDFTRAYLNLMRTRYGEQALPVDVRIDPALLDRQLPPISLQLLVENAIKHNVATPRRPLRITIEGTPDGLTVSNPLQPRDEEHPASGLGLSNLSQRYLLLSSRDITIHNDNDTFTVQIPLL